MPESTCAQLIHRLYTGMLKRLTRLFRRDPEDAQDTPAVRKRVQRLEIALGELHDDLAALRTRHETLAKRHYAHSGGRPRKAGDDPGVDDAHLTKAQLRQRLGIVPGRPYQPRLEDSSHGN